MTEMLKRAQMENETIRRSLRQTGMEARFPEGLKEGKASTPQKEAYGAGEISEEKEKGPASSNEPSSSFSPSEKEPPDEE